ncbi:MAG TPA: hypothetical protein PLD25_02735 [Chloroflexota bacterium]|nr:hypothetical protein [Chloroflexota bacterium]HUM69211.1 hypothetical protein [Chloroflexota bacterium]
MRRITTIFAVFIFVILGVWFLHNSLFQAVQASPLVPNTSTATSIWQIDTNIDNAVSAGFYTSLALDSHDNPHISYSQWISSNVKYAFWDGTNWQVELIENVGSGTSSIVTSLALDSNDYPHISYDYDEEALKYAYWDGANWQIQTVDNIGQTGRDNSLALDGNNYPHISYVQVDLTDTVKHAYWDGIYWQIQIVDTSAALRETSLALDSNGYPHITYRDWVTATNSDLKYAHWNGNDWQISIVDGLGDTGHRPSLALDSNDNPHITYYDSTNDDMKYAYWDGNNWQIETVDSAGDVGWDSALTLDSQDSPHISYHDSTNTALKYARWDGNNWQTETVEDAGGWFTSIALNTNEHPLISYYCNGCSPSLRLARWLGQTASVAIGVGGGVFTPTNSLTFTFPSGAFSEPVTITYTTVDPVAHTLTDIGIFYELTAVFTTTGQPAQLEPGETFTTVVQYDEADLPPGVSESSLGLYYAVSSLVQQLNNVTATWNPASSNVVNTETNEITAVDSHLGTWAVFSAEAGYEVFLPAVVKP